MQFPLLLKKKHVLNMRKTETTNLKDIQTFGKELMYQSDAVQPERLQVKELYINPTQPLPYPL